MEALRGNLSACCPFPLDVLSHKPLFPQTGWVEIQPLPLNTGLYKLLGLLCLSVLNYKLTVNNYAYPQSVVKWSLGPYPTML